MKRLRKPSKGQPTTQSLTRELSVIKGVHAVDIINIAHKANENDCIPMRSYDMDALLGADIFKNFEKTGKNEFLKFLKQHLKDNANPVFDKNNAFKVGISHAIYELFWHGLRCTLKKETVLHTLIDVVALHNDFSSVILDVVNILDTETSLMTDGIQEERLMFVQIVKDLDKVLPEQLLKERLEIDTLQEVGIVKNKSFYSKFIKIKTKIYYKQRRFNLFREESEGYAKLITELNQDSEEHVTSDALMDIIKSLIGCFNLDPNRVLDIILESFECRPERWQVFVPLLSCYMSSGAIICEVLGYKFCHFKNTRTPKSLLHLCALLLKYDVIKLDDIYVWLSPTDKVIASDWEKELTEAKEFLRKLNVIIVNKDKEPPEIEEVKPYDEDKYNANQKFGLCEALLKIGDWENVQLIIRKLPDYVVTVHEPIAHGITELIHVSVEHIYYSKCFKAPNSRRSPSSRNKLFDDAKVMEKLQVRSFFDLTKNVWPMATALGPGLQYDTILMYKIIRIMRAIILEIGVDALNGPTPNTEAETLYYDIMTCLDDCILPSLSYLDANCPMAEEIWSVLKCFPYYFRYSLYARWKNESYLMHPTLIRRVGLAQKLIKGLMKRVSRDNVKQIGRSLGKYSHCAPGLLFDYILLQIQIYDNLIGPVVDAFKYLTNLSFDCLGYCLIEALTSRDRDRMVDGTSISMWLQSLAAFCGAIFKKYNIELSGLLQYVANQLKMQKSLDLLILREVVQKMAGVESTEEMTHDQIQALCGGELLRGEAGYFSQVRNTKKSSQRLKDALANNDLAVALCLLMAQQKHCVIYHETAKSHLKLVGKLYDQCQDTLVQFGTFLGSTYSVDEYVERLPSIITMLQDYHINADVAFFLARPMFTHQINQKYDQLRKADPNAKKLTTAQKLQKYLEATNLIMNPIVQSVRPLHSSKVWEDISPQFLVTFWSLSMNDLQVPVDSYQREISKLKQLSMQAAESKDSNASKNKKEQERYIALMEKLNDERKKQHEHVDKISQRLQEQKDGWFLSRSAKSAKNDTITQFLQLCLFPRCTFTALDALYCATFVHTIHNLKTANFSTLLCYDRIFCDITYSVTSCTENEATRYGRFLCAMLETVMRWHSDQAIFNKECANYPGFVTKFRVSNQFSESNDHVDYENYRHVCHKWHYKITKAIVFCLDSKEYMQIRNALIILMRILPYYPILAKLSQIIERKVEKVREEEKSKRPDLHAIASSYIGQLKLKAQYMMKESEFHQVVERPIKETANTIATLSLNAVVGKQSTSKMTLNSSGVKQDLVVEQKNINNSKQENSAVVNVNNGDIRTEKTVKDERSVTEPKTKIIKLNPNTSSSSVHNNGNELRERDSVQSIATTSNRNNNIPVIEIKDDHGHNEREHEIRHTSISSSSSSGRALREIVKKEKEREERTRERERERERDRERARSHSNHHNEDLEVTSLRAAAKRDKRRDERQRNHSPNFDSAEYHEQRHNEQIQQHKQHDYEGHGHERDLSSVSNESNTSLQHRRTNDISDYEKDSKRRKLELSTASSKKQVEELVDSVKKARGLKTKERKEKMTEEEKDARKERKLGRKRERIDETNNSEHKRRREAESLVDESRERIKYNTRDKSPNTRARSHEKFESERRSSSSRNLEERQYSSTKSSTRSRANY